jgi:hypothetical protein
VERCGSRRRHQRRCRSAKSFRAGDQSRRRPTSAQVGYRARSYLLNPPGLRSAGLRFKLRHFYLAEAGMLRFECSSAVGCRMCHFCHAQLFEITRANRIKSPLLQHSCQNAKVVHTFEPQCTLRKITRHSNYLRLNPHSARCTVGALPPATSCLGAFRPPPAAIRGQAVIPAAENLHNTGLTFADLVRRKGAKQRSCSPAYLATKRRAAMPEVEKLKIGTAMKARH